MSNYKINDYSYDKAKKLNLFIKSSKNKAKKIDVYSCDNIFLGSIGDIKYNDHPNYCLIYGEKYANERKRLYHIRHKKGINIINTKQYLKCEFIMVIFFTNL